MLKSIKAVIITWFSPALTEYEQQMMAVKKYNMKNYGTVNSVGGYIPFKQKCSKGCDSCQCRPKPPQGE